MCMALVGLCASAQEKGDMAVGANLGVTPCLESGTSVTNFGIGAKFQYNVTDPIRLEAALDYGFKSKGADVFTLGVNAHYLFNLSDKLRVYPLAGVGYAHFSGGYGSYDGGDGGDGGDYDFGYDIDYDDMFEGDGRSTGSVSKFMLNVGAGIECDITSNIAVNAEIKYQYIKNFNRLPISIGVAYKF